MSRRPPLGVRLAVRLYRALAHLYPRWFRAAYGEAMADAFRRRSLEPALRGRRLARFWWLAFSELPASALRVRRGARAPLRRPAPADSSDLLPQRRSLVRSILQDLRFAVRSLARTPGIAAVALLTLALGIGANTAIFSVIRGILFHPLSVPRPERLMMFAPASDDGERSAFSYENFRDTERQATAFEAMSLLRSQSVAVTGGGQEPERIRGMFVTAGFFRALGEPPALGRPILSGEDGPGAPRTVVLSHGFWQRRWGADPQALGQQVLLNNHPHTIVGVMGEDFRFPFDSTEAWISVQTGPGELDRASTYFWAMGRLRDGVSAEQAQEELAVVTARLADQFPEVNRDRSASVFPLREAFVGDRAQRLFWVLLGSVGMVLLIGTANVANLQLARATGRGREMAIRTALGGGRGRLVRQLLTENLLLAAAGGVLGVAVAAAGVQLVVAYGPSWIGEMYDVHLDRGVLGFVAAVSLLTSVLFGLAPALRGARVDLTRDLRDGGRNVSAGRGGNRLRAALVVAQTALAVMLLIAAGLLLQSFARLQRVEVGFDRHDLLTLQFRLPDNRYDTDASVVGFFDLMLERVSAVPGVRGAATAQATPFTGDEGRYPMLADGFDPGLDVEVPMVYANMVSLDYFEVMGIPLERGRGFDRGDSLASRPVAVVSRLAGEALWPGEDPVGRTMAVRGDDTTYTVVGVVGDIRSLGLEGDWQPFVYAPYTQQPSRFATMAVRTSGDPTSYVTAVRDAVWSIDPDQPLWEIMTQDERIATWVDSDRFATSLLTVFAAVALLLAATGLAGVIAYMVGRRTHEFGVRLALGAGRGDILGLILRTGGLLVAGGAALGLVGAVALSRVLSSLLFGVDALDAATFAAAPAFLVAVGLVATWLPARRAARVDPVVALRYE